MEKRTKILTSGEHYAADYSLVVRQRDSDQETTLQIRRVIRNGIEELQMEICISAVGKKRNQQMHSSFTVLPDIADKIGSACFDIRGKT